MFKSVLTLNTMISIYIYNGHYMYAKHCVLSKVFYDKQTAICLRIHHSWMVRLIILPVMLHLTTIYHLWSLLWHNLKFKNILSRFAFLIINNMPSYHYLYFKHTISNKKKQFQSI